MVNLLSPFENLGENEWLRKTQELIETHPIGKEQLVEITLKSWLDIFTTQIGTNKLRIGIHLFPQPQIMGFFLHELIPLNIESVHSGWRRDVGGTEKDVVCETNSIFSFEIKTSSNPKQIFGNRSYAQENSRMKRARRGYLLAINFQGFKTSKSPKIVRIRFGWIDQEDWIGQASATGQQARLSKAADSYKLLDIL